MSDTQKDIETYAHPRQNTPNCVESNLCSRFTRTKGAPDFEKCIHKGCFYIRVVNSGCIDIAESFVLNSSNRKYHVNMYGPVKLIADGEGARVFIGKNNRLHGNCMHARGAITIGENCLIAVNC